MKPLFAILAAGVICASPVAAEQQGGLFALGAGLSGAAIAGADEGSQNADGTTPDVKKSVAGSGAGKATFKELN